MGWVVEILWPRHSGKTIRMESPDGSDWDAVLQRVRPHAPYNLVLHALVRQHGSLCHASEPIESAEDGAFSLSGCVYEGIGT